MRPINLSNIAEKAEGEFNRLKPGAYPCTIMRVEDVPDKEYFWVVVDIIAGDYKDYFSDAFYADKDYAHRLCFSYKESAQGMLKGRLHVISDCNHGFDAEAAINAGKEQMLVGKAVGVVFREEEYYNKKTGEFEMGSARPDRVCRLTELEEERNAKPKPKMLNESQKRAAMERAGMRQAAGTVVSASDDYSDDIPF
ncbi:hypothetical protein [Collinsella intestinalis]|uniref:hypothetical protein n=1 Tax=Collinsella intestinalis TaxID=147207 RepID=UPI0025A4318A|nr:hypothetical protein [Collinsella intestinalis]MDM8162443.1 hypothetical protein [Collinsella intestinalis]